MRTNKHSRAQADRTASTFFRDRFELFRSHYYGCQAPPRRVEEEASTAGIGRPAEGGEGGEVGGEHPESEGS